MKVVPLAVSIVRVWINGQRQGHLPAVIHEITFGL